MEPILIEAFMWITLILSTPVIWWVFRVLGEALGKWLFPGKVIELKFIDGEEIRVIRFKADDDDELVEALLSTRQRVKNSSKYSDKNKNNIELSIPSDRVLKKNNMSFSKTKNVENDDIGVIPDKVSAASDSKKGGK